MEYLWRHGIDLSQDAVIEAARERVKQTTGNDIDKYTMARIIILKYGEDMGKHAPDPKRLLKKYTK